MGFKKLFAALFGVSIALVALSACDTGDGSDSSATGGGTGITAEQGFKNTVATTPNCPYGEGYVFGGWYSDAALTKRVTVNSDFSKVKAIYPKWLEIPRPISDVNVRSDTVKITDSGREKQRMDVLYLSDHYDVQGLYIAGYTRLKITFTFDVREIDDGYQYVFFYSDDKCNANSIVTDILGVVGIDNDDSFLYGHKFEHGSGNKDTSWKTHTFTAELSMKDLKKDLYIRYGASGKYEDDWQNRNVMINYEALK